MSEDMSPYCSPHDEWLIMKRRMYLGYHDAINVSNVGGDPVAQLNSWWFNCVCASSEHVCPMTCRHIARRMMNG